jgi:DNA topoisomerase-3
MSDILMVCPKCGKNIVENNKAYGCEGWKDDPKCNVTIFKEFIGATITRNEAIALFEGKEVEKELTSKAGNTWKQKIAFNRETGKLEFVKTAGATLNTQEPNITSFECPACHKNLMRDGYKLICDCGQSFAEMSYLIIS